MRKPSVRRPSRDLSGEAERNQLMGDGCPVQWRALGRPRKESGVIETGCGVSPMEMEVVFWALFSPAMRTWAGGLAPPRLSVL